MMPLPKPRTTPLEQALEILVREIARRVAEQVGGSGTPRLLTLTEAAQYLHRSRRWVQLEMHSGRLQYIKVGKSRPRFDRQALDQWIERYNGRD
jgi:excisionase family DNA binding protein